MSNSRINKGPRVEAYHDCGLYVRGRGKRRTNLKREEQGNDVFQEKKGVEEGLYGGSGESEWGREIRIAG